MNEEMRLIVSKVLFVFEKSGTTIWTLLPYIIIGSLAGELLRYTSWARIITGAIKKMGFTAVIGAAALGIVSPLCTYATIPLIVPLIQSGMQAAPLIAFLSASSMMNPQLFMLTIGGINVEMAVARTLSVMVFAVAAGYLTMIFPKGKLITAGAAGPLSDERVLGEGREKKMNIKTVSADFLKSIEFLGFYVVLGVVAGAIVEIFVPGRLVADYLSSDKYSSIVIASLLGVPLYVCGGGTIPLINSLMAQGMGKGAALAFLTAGPATRITPLMAMGAIFKPGFIFFYIVGIIGFAMFAGYLF